MINEISKSLFSVVSVGFLLASVSAGSISSREILEDMEEKVEVVHERSLQRRQEVMEDILSEESLWPHGKWGDLMWSLVALYQNNRVNVANERLFEKFDGRVLENPGLNHSDRVRIFSLFNSHTGRYPGRLDSKTENVMTEVLWAWVSSRSKVEHAETDTNWLWITHGTENHDLQWKPAYYHLAHIYKNHPDYRDREYEDGYTAEEHFEAWNEYWKKWIKERAAKGMWIELGSSTYRKYSYPALFNLYDLSPDPELRKRAKTLLDLAFIEEAQISLSNGIRAGGKSRVGKRPDRHARPDGFHGFGGFEGIKDLFHGENGSSSHSRVFETSGYQLPAQAIAVHGLAFEGRFEPFVISNRVPGELADPRKDNLQDGWYHLSPDSALINYTYRTPDYMLGSTLQYPANRYAAISHQNRWSGIIFDNVDGVQSGVLPHPDHSRPENTRTHDAYWNFQHENVMIVQRLDKDSTAYIGDRGIMIYFSPDLEREERESWVFATNGEGFIGVRPAYGGYKWNDTDDWGDKMLIIEEDYAPVLFHAGCPADGHESFEDFQQHVLGVKLRVEEDRILYDPPEMGAIEFFVNYNLPRMEGKEINLRPDFAYNSPYMKGKYGGDKITVNFGPYETVYDFAENE